jgi:hypothetical protein
MDEQVKDRILVEGKDTPYALVVMELLAERKQDIMALLGGPQPQDDLTRINGAFMEVNYLINRINCAEAALQADQIIETEYPDEVEEK